MEKKRILVVDDSALMRRIESGIIASDNRLTVVQTCTNGLEAYDLIKKKPDICDVVLIEIVLPKMTGLEFLASFSKERVNFKTIIISSLAKLDSKETIQALQLGAFDCIEKPESYAEVMGEEFKKKIVDKIILACGLHEDFRVLEHPKPSLEPGVREERKSLVSPTPTPHITSESVEAHVVSPMNAREILAAVQPRRIMHTAKGSNAKKLILIASSTGGPKALQEVIPLLPKNINAPVLLVQHMAVGFTKSLAQRLDQESEITVVEAEDGAVIHKGTVYIAMGGAQMRLRKVGGEYVINLNHEEPPRAALKPCADILFESIVGMDFDEIICCVLTGMGGDGTMGINALTGSNNCYVIAQDESTSTVYGMPKVLVDSGLTDAIKPLGQVAQEIIKSTGVLDYGC